MSQMFADWKAAVCEWMNEHSCVYVGQRLQWHGNDTERSWQLSILTHQEADKRCTHQPHTPLIRAHFDARRRPWCPPSHSSYFSCWHRSHPLWTLTSQFLSWHSPLVWAGSPTTSRFHCVSPNFTRPHPSVRSPWGISVGSRAVIKPLVTCR